MSNSNSFIINQIIQSNDQVDESKASYGLSDSDLNDSKSKSDKDIKNISLETINSIDSEQVVYQFKIILIGSVYVGKTSILNRCIENRYSSNYKCSIGVEFKVKSLELDSETIVDLKIWDTCGDERYRAITRQYYNNTDGVLLIFDITDKSTFYSIDEWYRDVKENTPSDVCIYLVANKIDLVDLRKVTTNEGKECANKLGIKFTEVSAKSGINVTNLFFNMAQDIVQIKKDKNNIDGFKMDDYNNNSGGFNISGLGNNSKVIVKGKGGISKKKGDYSDYGIYVHNGNKKCC